MTYYDPDALEMERRATTRRREDQAHEDLRKEVRRQMRGVRWSVWALIFVFTAGGGLILLDRDLRFAHDRRAGRDALVSSCVQYNQQQAAAARAEKAEWRKLTDHIAPRPRSAQVQRRVDEFLDDQDATITAEHAYRDCSEQGLDAYFENPPPDPAAKNDPKGNS